MVCTPDCRDVPMWTITRGRPYGIMVYSVVSWRADVIRPYNGLSIGIRIRAGRPCGVAPTMVYRLICGLVPGDHTGSPLWFHIDNYDVSCRWMLTALQQFIDWYVDS